ncbi:hypothetical protein [Labilithrix luteola]|nr:hypothetical protein [Labilithrix luteola]
MRSRRTSSKLDFALAGIVVASIGGASACLPSDEDTARGALYVELDAAPLVVEQGSFSVSFERLAMLAGADAVDCHSYFVVERPLGAVAVIDLMKPYTFEHRALTETECAVAAGFISTTDTPHVAQGVSPEDGQLLASSRVGEAAPIGNMHIVARVRSGTSPSSVVERRIDLLLTGIAGGVRTPRPITVPRGDKRDVFVRFDTSRLLQALQVIALSHPREPGIVSTEQLRPWELDTVTKAATNAWSFRTVSDAGLDGP